MRKFLVLCMCALVSGGSFATPKVAGAEAATPLPMSTPAAVGLSAERLEHMAAFFRAEVERNEAAGYTLMVARYGKLVYQATGGMRDLERGVPMSLDTRFRITCMTKPVTSVAVLMLYEDGRFKLDDPISKYLPEFSSPTVYTGTNVAGALQTTPAKHPITIRQLLSNSAGLGYGYDYDLVSPLGKSWLALPMGGSLADTVREIARLPLYFEPGESWRYSYAQDVLGRLVEVVSGMPFERFLGTRLFSPLGMSHTGFSIAAGDAPLLATVYRNTAAGGLEVADISAFEMRWASGGVGLISTTGDYLRFAQMLANGGKLDGRRYLSPVTVGLLTSSQVPADAMFKFWGADSLGRGYGLGVSVILDAAHSPQADLTGDYAWNGRLDTHWVVSPESGLVAVLLKQIDDRGAYASHQTDPYFRNLLFAAVDQLKSPAGPQAAH